MTTLVRAVQISQALSPTVLIPIGKSRLESASQLWNASTPRPSGSAIDDGSTQPSNDILPNEARLAGMSNEVSAKQPLNKPLRREARPVGRLTEGESARQLRNAPAPMS